MNKLKCKSMFTLKRGFNFILFIHELTINPGTVTEEPVPPPCVYCGQTFWIPLCVVVLEEQNSVPLPRSTDVCWRVWLYALPSPRHGWTGRVRSHERTIHEDRGGLPARLLGHRQREVSDGCRHSYTNLSACLHTSVCCSQPHTLSSSRLASLLL